MKLRLYNARYLDSNDMTVKEGTVCTNGERFSYVGKKNALRLLVCRTPTARNTIR